MVVEILLLSFLLGSQPSGDSVARAALLGHRVVFSFDDGHRSVYDFVYPLLKKYRMKATLAVIANTVTGKRVSYRSHHYGYYITPSEIKEMLDSCGIEIASHSLSHAWLTEVDSATAWQEIYRSRVVLESLFGVPVITFVYPYGALNSRVVRMVKRAGYRLARAVRWGVVDFWADPYRLPEFELRREVSLEAVKEHIRQHRTAILLLHRVVSNPTRFTEWSGSDFAALVEWLHQEGAEVVTLSELYEDWRREVVNRLILDMTPGRDLLKRNLLFEDVDVDITGTGHPR